MQYFLEKGRKMTDTKKYFIQRNGSDKQITSSTDIDLIQRIDKTVWVMNHIFLNPDEHDEHELSLLMQEVITYVKNTDYPIWVLDPIAIKYFEKYPDLKNIWYHKPYQD